MRASTATLLPLTLLLLLAAWSVRALAPGQTRSVDALADALRFVAHPSDLVLTDDDLLPLYFDRFAGLAIVATHSAPDETDAFERVFVVSRRVDSALDRGVRLRSELLWSDRIDEWEIRLYEPSAAHHVLLDAASSLPRASVRMVRDDESWDCPWNGAAFRCGPAEWQEIRVTSQVIAGQVQRCIWTHPVDHATVEITFPPAPGTESLHGWYAISDYAASVGGRARIVIEVQMGSLTRRFRLYGQRGRRPLRMEVPRDGDAPLTLRITTAEQGVRHLCWDLQQLRRRS